MSRKVPLILQLGCGQLVALLVVTSVLLAADTFAVSLPYQAWREYRGQVPDNPRIVQTVLITGPLVLLVLQYWLYDRVRDYCYPPPSA